MTSEELDRYLRTYYNRDSLLTTAILRISKLEFLDETEELDLVLAHYAISWGLFLGNSDMNADWGHWGLKQQQEV